jgi:hypothetical protein
MRRQRPCLICADIPSTLADVVERENESQELKKVLLAIAKTKTAFTIV